MSILYRTERWLTIAQLVRAWGYELAKGPEDREQYVQDLLHILLVDILNGRLDDSGPLMDDQRLGLRLITPENKAAFIEGHQVRALLGALHYIVVMKEAVLDFARRHELPPPSWWTDSTEHANTTGKDSHPTQALTDLARPPRGRRPKKREQVEQIMRESIRQGRMTQATLRDMLEKDLAADYGVSRDTARKARDAVLSGMPPTTTLPSITASST